MFVLLPLSRKGCCVAVFLKSPFTNSWQTEYSSFFSCLARPPATPRRPRLPAPHFPHMPPPAVQTATTLALPFSPALLPRDVHWNLPPFSSRDSDGHRLHRPSPPCLCRPWSPALLTRAAPLQFPSKSPPLCCSATWGGRFKSSTLVLHGGRRRRYEAMRRSSALLQGCHRSTRFEGSAWRSCRVQRARRSWAARFQVHRVFFFRVPSGGAAPAFFLRPMVSVTASYGTLKLASVLSEQCATPNCSNEPFLLREYTCLRLGI